MSKIISAPLRLCGFIAVVFALLIPSGAIAQKAVAGKSDSPPEWSKHAIWYQIFVERFYNGDASNDPKPANINIPPLGVIAPEGWKITPWTQDWYGHDSWWMNDRSFGDNLQFRRYGGDLRGVIDKLGYLLDLGINAIFLNPINDAPSLHKYDVRNYHHIDVNFGPDPDGDNRLIASENPADPATWKWTSADKLFLELVKKAHALGMRIIMDYSWNHTGVMFWAWQDILKNQEKSAYKDWFAIRSFDDPATPGNEFAYSGWANVPSLPEIRKTDVIPPRVNGYPYEGNINEGAKKHIFAVAKRWLAPDGDPSRGIDGFRLDVADQVGMGFWREFRKTVRSVKPDAYLVGEIWWAKWPDKLMDPIPYTGNGIFDAVMLYQAYKPARYFFAKNDYGIDAKALADSLTLLWGRMPSANRHAMMNTASSHDTPRLLTDFYNPNRYKFHSSPSEDSTFLTGKPDEETYRRLKLYLLFTFTSIGAPHIWNGEEMGMWGADDPYNRKPLWWKEFTFEKETRNNWQPGEKSYDPVGFNQGQFDWYKLLAGIRKNHPALATGAIEFMVTEGKKLVYKRFNDKEEILVLFNLEATSQTFTLPKALGFVNLLTGKPVKGREMSVRSLDGVVLKVSK
ncbi:MAG TPA: glycoside hydrolase family 13 protein [Bacteroidales bacterium]|nr:glycoside hydrolase family 13 protein [Bacteroidales bacterium]